MRYELAEACLLGNRHDNEDRLGIVESPEGVLLILADGLGGHPGGASAAQVLVDTATAAYRKAARPIADPTAFLAATLKQTHAALVKLGTESERIPATTAVLCLVQAGTAHWAHSGDSRLYLFRDGLPLVRSRDHSYVEQLVQAGRLRRDEVEQHPRRHQITRCVGGMADPLPPEFGAPRRLAAGDILLLCSDGFWGGIDDVQIGAVLQEAPLAEAISRLAAHAERNRAPHSDNVSVVALQLTAVEEVAPAPKAAQPEPEDPKARLRDAIANIEEALREYGPELKR